MAHAHPATHSALMASLTPTELDSPAPTELDSPPPTELELDEEQNIHDIILPLDSNTFDESLNSTAPLLVADDTVPLLVADDTVDASIMPSLPVQARLISGWGVLPGHASSGRGVLPSHALHSHASSGPLPVIEDSLPDDRMNGSAMPNLTETQEADLRRARAPPVVLWAVPDVLAMQPQPGTSLTSGDGMLAVAGAMRSIIAPPSSAVPSNIVWILPNVGDDLFNHCCRIINDIQVVFYIGITEDPNSRWETHSADQTVGPEPNMVVLIEAESSRLTAALEIQLLAHYLSYMRCANRSPGGERASTASPHYLYVLEASSPLLRRGH